MAFKFRNERNFVSNRDGASAVYIGLVLPILIGFVALGLEVGDWIYQKGRLQNLADASAYAALAEKNRTSSGNMFAAAQSIAVASGLDQDAEVLTVHSPPIDGAFQDTDLVQAKISKVISPTLSKLFGQESFTMNVSAVAGYTNQTLGDSCCFCSLAEAGASTIDIKGGATLKLNECAIALDSQDEKSLNTAGKIDVTASCLYTYGSIPPDAFNLQLTCEEPIRMSQRIIDPYEQTLLEYGAKADDVADILQNCNATVDIEDITNHQCGSTSCGELGIPCTVFQSNQRINNDTELPAGLFIFDDVSLSVNKGVVSGTDVAFYLKGTSDLNIAGQAQLGCDQSNCQKPLKARSEDPFKGMLFFSDLTNTEYHQFVGGSNSNYEGALYFPSSLLKLSGNSATGEIGFCTQFVANTLDVLGTTDLNVEQCAVDEGNILEKIEISGSSNLIRLYE